MNDEELEILIPSKYVRDYVKKTAWKFTDMQKACLISHNVRNLKQNYQLLKNLKETTEDTLLQEQLSKELDYIECCFESFVQNDDKKYIYSLEVDEGTPYNDKVIYGYFFDWKTAYECGLTEKLPFTIKKNIVLESKKDYADMEEETCYPFVAHYTFDENGEATIHFANFDVKYPADDTWFDRIFFELPNPFEKGDIVKIAANRDKEYHGIVVTSKQEWKEIFERNYSMDFSDLIIGIEFIDLDYEGLDYDHVCPLDIDIYTIPDADILNSPKLNPEQQLLGFMSRLHKGNGECIQNIDYYMKNYKDYMKNKK